MWSAGISSALMSGANPTLMPIAGFSSIYGDISKYISKSVKYINTTANTYIFSASSIVSRISSSSLSASTRVLGSLSGKASSSVIDLTKTGFKTIYKVVEKALTTPQGFMLVLATYKLADYFAPPSPESVLKYLDDIAENIDRYSISIPEISFPRVDLTHYAESLDRWVNDVKDQIDRFVGALVLPPYNEWINKYAVECGNPPAWHDIGGWISYGLCTLGSILFKGFMSLVYGLGWIGVEILKILSHVGKLLLDAINFIGKLLLNVIQTIANMLLSFISFVVNSVIKILVWLANGLVNVFIKMPATLFIRFVLKPIVYMSITVLMFVKENLKRALCYLLKMYPALSMGMGLAEGVEKKGLRGALKSAFARFIGYGLTVSMLIPECSAFTIPGYQQGIMPEPVERLDEISHASMVLPKQLSGLVVASVRVEEYNVIRGSLIRQAFVMASFKPVEYVNISSSTIQHSQISIKPSTLESGSVSTPKIIEGNMSVSMNMLE